MNQTPLLPWKGMISGVLSGFGVFLLVRVIAAFKLYRIFDGYRFSELEENLLIGLAIAFFGLAFLIPALLTLRVQMRRYRTNLGRSFLFIASAGWLHFWASLSAISIYEDSWPPPLTLLIIAALVLTPVTVVAFVAALFFRKSKSRITAATNVEVLDDQLIDE